MKTAITSFDSNRNRARGFSIVEALVALIVLSVGMLGIAGLYVVTLRSSGSAISRMQAVNLASDLADRIRANRTAESEYEAPDVVTEAICVGEGKDCTPAQMAANDMFLWQRQIDATLPGDPAGAVDVDEDTNPTTYIIEVSWAEPGEKGRLRYRLRMQI
jgi:type IV pilus assembly protein PilV